ncbi:MAG: asparagine synthase (glutamine-hydrolyzing) [Tsuneonella sp.]
MCGIAGVISQRPITGDTVERMIRPIHHRGPDDSGVWIDPDSGTVGLGHRRLSIIDLSAAGHQPMHSPSGRYVLTYNGEIYNFAELRAELENGGAAPEWKGHSDTEVLLAAIEAWGIERALERARGMWALALFDRQSRVLHLSIDRFGEKPLYYGWTDFGFAFASGLDPIRSLPGFDNPIDPAALRCLLGRAYIPAPLSIYRRIYKVEPGTIVRLTHEGVANRLDRAPQVDDARRAVSVTRYYDYARVVADGFAEPFEDHEAATEGVRSALEGAIGHQLVADVPIGAFLSGGIDSSLVVGLASRLVSKPLATFTIGFDVKGYDEAVYAKEVAKHFGTHHHELYVSADDAREVIPQLPAMYDEPFADSSQIPTHLVSRLAREHVTVSLSGDAGDELFGGYNRHTRFPSVWRRMARLPAPLRRAVMAGAGSVPPMVWNRLADLGGKRRSDQFGHNARRALRVMGGARDFDALFATFLDDWAFEGDPVASHEGRERAVRLGLDPALEALPLELRMMHADAMSYLPGDILTKVDRASMAVSLESRVPFLDPAVASAAARVPLGMKFGPDGGKQILRDILFSIAPRALFDRPKAGFAVPIGQWIRGDLRDWAEDLLSPEALAGSELLDAKVIRARWRNHLEGKEDATQPLWAVLMFQAWRLRR